MNLPLSNAEQRTIHDVAHALGVSARTVSRVLNDLPGVGAATRARVAAYIAESGYQPHSGARSLRSPQLDCIGFALTAPPDIVPLSADLLAWLFSELYRLFGARGKFVCFDLTGPQPGVLGDYARGIWSQRFGATVLAGAFSLDDAVLERVHRSGHPYVCLARLARVPEANTASVDYEEGAYLAVRTLIERGHKRIGMLQALAGYQPGIDRRDGYLRAHAEAGLPVDERLIKPTPFRAAELVALTHRLLADASVTGLVDASGAQDAESLREGARRAGRVPGRDFEVVVWTYTYNAVVLAEACAHVWLPLREACSEGLERLAERVFEDRRDPCQVLYRPQLLTPEAGGEIPAPKPVFSVYR